MTIIYRMLKLLVVSIGRNSRRGVRTKSPIPKPRDIHTETLMHLEQRRMRITEIFRLVDSEHLLSGSSDGDIVVHVCLQKLECAEIGVGLQDDCSTDLRCQESTLGRKSEGSASSSLPTGEPNSRLDRSVVHKMLQQSIKPYSHLPNRLESKLTR